MEAMAARNTALEESQRQMQETMQAQMAAIAVSFIALYTSGSLSVIS